MTLTLEGFAREITEGDRRAFTKWILQQGNLKDYSLQISLFTTRGELTNFINITFTLGFHHKQVFQWFLDNYIHRKKRLYWWSLSIGREFNQEIRVRKTLSEDARLRGRYVKAAMEAINEERRNEVEFYPSWNENTVHEK